MESADRIIITREGDKEICHISPYNCSFTIHSNGELAQYAPEFRLLNKTICLEFYWNSDTNTHGYTIYFVR